MQFFRQPYSIFSLIFILFFAIYYSCSSNSDNRGSESTIDVDVLGKKVYKKYCINCHGYNGDMGAQGAYNLQLSKLSFEEKKLVVLKGKNTMTSFEEVLSEQEIHDVIVYITQFSISEEQ